MALAGGVRLETLRPRVCGRLGSSLLIGGDTCVVEKSSTVVSKRGGGYVGFVLGGGA